MTARGAGGERRNAAPPSASERGWGPASAERRRQDMTPRLAARGSQLAAQRRTRAVFFLLSSVSCLLFVAGCRQDMHNQPKYRGLRASTFFADGSSARPLVEGTVARGTLQDDEAFFTGKRGTEVATELPFPLTPQVLDRGQERFNIFCAPCHDRAGTGRGMVVQRGYTQPPSYHIDRLRDAPLGYFVDVMTKGIKTMPDYKAQIAPRDRWAIAAYIKALQISQHAAVSDVPGGDPAKLAQPAGDASGGERQ